MSRSDSEPPWLNAVKRHALVANLILSPVIGASVWFASGQAALIKLAAADARVDGLNGTVADLRAAQADTQAELGRLRASEQSERQTSTTCEQARAVLMAQVQPMANLQAQDLQAQAELATLRGDAALANMLNDLLKQERELNQTIGQTILFRGQGDRAASIGSDPTVLQLEAQRHDLAEHINMLLTARPELRSATAVDASETGRTSSADLWR